jgi:hypothetical protein
MANTNCLAGWKCPNCGFTESFNIDARCTVEVHDDGTDDATGFEWSDDDTARCNKCGASGTVKWFTARTKVVYFESLERIQRIWAVRVPEEWDDTNIMDAFWRESCDECSPVVNVNLNTEDTVLNKFPEYLRREHDDVIDLTEEEE